MTYFIVKYNEKAKAIKILADCESEKKALKKLETLARQFIAEEDGKKVSERPLIEEGFDYLQLEDGHFLVKPKDNYKRLDLYLKKTIYSRGYVWDSLTDEIPKLGSYFIVEYDSRHKTTLCTNCQVQTKNYSINSNIYDEKTKETHRILLIELGNNKIYLNKKKQFNEYI